MQSLSIIPRLLPEVRAGSKRHTIRWREREILPGPMRYASTENADDSTVVEVTEINRIQLSSVAQYLGKSDEWTDTILLAGMREHYPEIQLDSVVDVISHHLAPNKILNLG